MDQNLKPGFKSGRTSVGVWPGYCGDEMGPLVIIEERRANDSETISGNSVKAFPSVLQTNGYEVWSRCGNARG